jgi:ATP-dependent DNA helicase PIF1
MHTLVQLTKNMMLDSRGLSDSDREELHVFAEWLLRVGSGVEHSIQIGPEYTNKYIKIPQFLLLPQHIQNLDGLISFVYCLGCELEDPSSYFTNRAILCPINEVVAMINAKMIEQLTSQEMSYYNSDLIDDSTANHSTMEALYPTEFLNTLLVTGLSDHILNLKIGIPVMLL